MDENLFGRKECPFKVPDNYFEDFEQRILARIEAETASERSKNSLAPVISVIKPWLAMAAAFLVIALIYYQAPKLFNGSDETAILGNTDEEFINSLALILDENVINELFVAEDSSLVLLPDTLFWGEFTEEELAAVTYFE
ncbi:MAG: hypothetical protein PWQ17_1669 [Anaerophaga sp.]|uniref:hypothetical protein n=1 Tax=Anaerophaga thermohalophila TaxID=177400 RepID=UPI000237D1C8|nr:hypothetical protein [Anaerophaga thermohalophila]MDI3520451.1 hypothetical protein [Anaerophaga sp.]MDK2842164.1 hypothetical protein [Anaerophaga sp.]MDN5290957.1 hypothetical protein [Anaerophaga sp.]